MTVIDAAARKNFYLLYIPLSEITISQQIHVETVVKIISVKKIPKRGMKN